MNESLILAAKKVLKKLNDSGFEAYFVGGFVRDTLIGRESNDIDITTNATPEEVMNIFPDNIPTGLQHGTITVKEQEEMFEVTTYRIDGEYSDSRRPDTVTFSSDVTEDLSRRDLTINAMAMDYHGDIVDPFEGHKDLLNKKIRTVGDPNKRFQEDPLRLLRTIRFATRFNFNIEQETLEAVKKNAHLMKNISKERITDEIIKIFSSDSYLIGLKQLQATGLMKEIFSEGLRNESYSLVLSNKYKSEVVTEERIANFLNTKRNFTIFCDSLKLSNKQKEIIGAILNALNITEEKDLRRVCGIYGEEVLKSILNVNGITEERFFNLSKLPNSIKEINIDGNILKDKLNIEGRALGEVLKECLGRQLEIEKVLTQEELIEISKSYLSSV